MDLAAAGQADSCSFKNGADALAAVLELVRQHQVRLCVCVCVEEGGVVDTSPNYAEPMQKSEVQGGRYNQDGACKRLPGGWTDRKALAVKEGGLQ